MRSRKTTNILLLLAFLFILMIIILCLLPTDKKPGHKPSYKEFGQHEPEKTTSRTSPRSTTTTITTTKQSTTGDEETTLSTTKTTSQKYFPPSTVKEEKTSYSSTPSLETTSESITTTLILTTLPKYLDTSTQHSTHKETHNETTTVSDTFTETSYEPSENETSNHTSTLSTITRLSSTNTTTPITMPLITTTTTTPTTTTPTTTVLTTTTTPSTTTTPTTTTTTLPTTTPYDHVFTLYDESQGICTSDGCKDISSKMLDSMDHGVDPCEDFHEFSCGGVHKDEFLRSENAEETLDNILKEQLVSHDTEASRFYNSCLSYLDGTENLKHEEIFFPDWKVNFPKKEITHWPSEALTKIISSLIKRDLPILFDVSVDVRKINGTIKVLPKLRISSFDDYEDHYDHKYCIDQFDRRMLKRNNNNEEEHVPLVMVANYRKGRKPNAGKGKPQSQTGKFERLQMGRNTTTEEEEIDIDINDEYRQYLECMSTTGLDLRIKRLESVLLESDLFDEGLKPFEKQVFVDKVRDLLTNLNEILLTPTTPDGAGQSFTITTLGDMIGNTLLGGLIKWDDLFEDLHGFKVPESQEILVESLPKFLKIFKYFKEKWEDKNLENVLLMLAGEKLFKKFEDRNYKKDFCFKITKKYLPLHMQLLFTKAFSKKDLEILISEIHNLGTSLPAKFAQISKIYYSVPTLVEFIDEETLKYNMEHLKSELIFSGHFLDDLNMLQTIYRRNMYNMTGNDELDDPDSCRLLPRDIQINCNLHSDRILVPMEQLVPPNFLFEKDMPNYLRLAGVAYFMAKMMALKLGTEELNMKDYKGNDCLIENVPTIFEERNSKLKIKYQANVDEEMKSETLLEFQAFNAAWQVIKNLATSNSSLQINETEELPLIWLGADSLNPLKVFLIRKAQESCNQDNKFDLIRIARFKSPPKSFWINTLIKIDTLYGGAWHCPANSSMEVTRECPLERSTSAWVTVHPSATTTKSL